jgi:hypothetical protein
MLELSAEMRVSPAACRSIEAPWGSRVVAPPGYRVTEGAKNSVFSDNIDFPDL